MKVQVDDQDYEVLWVHHNPQWDQREITKLTEAQAKTNSRHLGAVLARTTQLHKQRRYDGAIGLRGYTDCYIEEIMPVPQTEDDTEVVKHTLALASAYCSWADQFNYERARKLSLTRALSKAWDGEVREYKAFRRAFWDAYFSRPGHRGYRIPGKGAIVSLQAVSQQ